MVLCAIRLSLGPICLKFCKGCNFNPILGEGEEFMEGG